MKEDWNTFFRYGHNLPEKKNIFDQFKVDKFVRFYTQTDRQTHTHIHIHISSYSKYVIGHF